MARKKNQGPIKINLRVGYYIEDQSDKEHLLIKRDCDKKTLAKVAKNRVQTYIGINNVLRINYIILSPGYSFKTPILYPKEKLQFNHKTNRNNRTINLPSEPIETIEDLSDGKLLFAWTSHLSPH